MAVLCAGVLQERNKNRWPCCRKPVVLPQERLKTNRRVAEAGRDVQERIVA